MFKIYIINYFTFIYLFKLFFILHYELFKNLLYNNHKNFIKVYIFFKSKNLMWNRYIILLDYNIFNIQGDIFIKHISLDKINKNNVFIFNLFIFM